MNTKRAREAEIYLDAARASDGGLLLLFGESGTGKTFFLSRLREAAETAAVGPIHAAAADEFESEIPYSFIERLISTTPAARSTIDPSRSQVEIARQVLLALSGHPQGTIRTVLLDDVHWVDAASERVLRYVAPRLVSQGVFLVCSARPQPGAETLAWHLSDEAQLHANWRTIEFTKGSDARLGDSLVRQQVRPV
ncbi:MAG: ATP-binding protein, partial [Microbacteriaceae bacterium]